MYISGLRVFPTGGMEASPPPPTIQKFAHSPLPPTGKIAPVDSPSPNFHPSLPQATNEGTNG